MNRNVTRKSLKNFFTIFLVVFGFVTTISCRDNNNRNDPPNDVKGNTYGTPPPGGNENSGETDMGLGDRNPNDTVTTTTNHGNNPNSEGEDNETDLRP